MWLLFRGQKNGFRWYFLDIGQKTNEILRRWHWLLYLKVHRIEKGSFSRSCKQCSWAIHKQYVTVNPKFSREVSFYKEFAEIQLQIMFCYHLFIKLNVYFSYLWFPTRWNQQKLINKPFIFFKYLFNWIQHIYTRRRT